MLKKIAILSLAIELATVFFRFAFNLKAGEATKIVSAVTFGLRIHHGYIGLLLMLASTFVGERYRRDAMILGAALFISDAVHHFIVLKLMTGSAEFDIFYG